MDFNLNLANQVAGGVIPQGSDAALMVIFSMKRIPDPIASAAQGKKVEKEIEWIAIHCPEGKNVVERKPTDDDKRRFAVQYAHFKNTGQNRPPGTLIEDSGLVTEDRANELKAARVLTVEQLAHSTDQTLQVLGPDARSLRERAQQWLAAREKSANAEATAKENEELRARLAALEAKLSDAPKPKRSRQKKQIDPVEQAFKDAIGEQ